MRKTFISLKLRTFYNVKYCNSNLVKIILFIGPHMKELYREIKINKPGLRFLPELSLSGLAEVVYFDLRLYFLHGPGIE